MTYGPFGGLNEGVGRGYRGREGIWIWRKCFQKGAFPFSLMCFCSLELLGDLHCHLNPHQLPSSVLLPPTLSAPAIYKHFESRLVTSMPNAFRVHVFYLYP